MTDQYLGKWGKYVVNPPAETKTEPVLEVPTSESNLGKWAKYEVKKKDEPTSVPSSGSEKSLELPSASTGNKNESDQPLTFIQKELRDKGLVADENAASVNSSNDAYKSAVFAKIKDPEQQKILGKSIDEANKFFANLGGKTPFQKIDEYNDGVKKLQASITPDVVASMDKNGISNLETQLAEKSKQLAIDLGLDTDDKGNVYVPKNEQAMYDQKLDDYVATETAKSKKEQGWFSNMIYGLAGATQTMSADLLDVAGFMTGLNYFNSYKQLAEGDRFNAQKLTEKSAKYDQSIQGYLENGDVVSAAGLAVTKSIESIPAMMPVLLSSLAPEAMAPSIGSAIMGATSAAGKYRSIENENVPEWKKIYNAVSTGAIMMGAMHEFGTTLLDARKAILDLGETAGKQAIENAAKKTMFSTLSDIKLPSYIRGGLNMTALGIGTDITDKVTINPELKIGSHMVDDFVVGALMDKTFALPQDLRKGLDYKQTQKFATEVLNKLPDDLDIETKILLGNKIVERDRLQQMEDKLDPKFKGKYETQLITLNSEIDKAASNYLGKAKVEEVPDLSVGKMDEVGNEQTKLDYLKEKEVKVPDGATMEQLNALYEETKAKEQSKNKKPLKTEQDAGKIGEKANLGSQEKALIEGEDRGVRLRNNEKPRVEAEAGVVEAPKQKVTQNISETNIKTTENGKIDAERQRGQGNQEGLLTPEENVTVTEPQNIEAPIKTQKIKAKSAEIASAIRSKRFYTSMDDLVNLKGDIAPIELIKTAWDGSLNVAAGIVEVGGEAAQVVSDAITAAVKHLEESEWYKGLSEESKAIASRKLSDEIKLKTKDLVEEANQEPIKVNVGEGEKISSVGKRIVESTKLPQEIKDQFAEEGIGYIPTSKAMRTEEAKEIIKAKLEMGGRDEVRNQILDTKNGIAPNVRVTMASIFASESLREYANAKTLEEATKFRNDATDVMQFAMEYGESLGKGVQAFTDIADMLGSDPELIGEVYKKEINKRNEKFYEKHEKNIKTAKQIIDEYLKSDEFLKKYGEKRAKKEGEITPKERKERGMAKAANAINRIADLVNARLNFEGEIEKGDNIYKAVVDLADGLLDIGVSSIQELSSKMKVELRKYLTSEQVDKISKDVFSEIKANDRLTVRKKIIKIEESDAKKIVDKLYSKMIGVSQRQLAKLLSENIELFEKEGSISDQAFKELFAKSLGQDHIKDGMLDKLKSNAKKINDVKNIEESISKLFDEAAEAEKNGTSKERILELKKQINRKIKEHAIATFEAAKANQYISESFAKPTTIAERAAAHIKGNLMVPGSLVSNVTSNLDWIPARKAKNVFQILYDFSLSKVGFLREHIQSKIIKNIQDFQESESQRLGIPKEDVVVPKNLTDAMNILDKLPSSQRTKIHIGLNKDYLIGFFGKGMKEATQQMWTGALGDDIQVRELGRAMHPLNALFDNIQMLKGKEEFETKKFIYNSIEATLGVPPELIFRSLNFWDKPFRRGEERSRLAEIADIKGLTGIERRRFIEMPDAESMKIATEEGLESIYAQGNLPSEISTSIDRWLATHKVERFGILDRPIRGILTIFKTTSVPFVKTPVNFLIETLDYAIPELAFTKALIYASLGKRYKFTDSMARGTVGLVINNMIWSLFANGILSLAPGGNEEEKKKNVQAKVLAAEYRDKPAYYINTDAFMRHLSNKIHGTNLSTEWQQGDEISSYKRYGIWSAIMMGQAEMYRGKTPEEIRNMSIMERSFVSAPAIITSALDQSFVTGISALLNAVTGTGAEAESWVMNTTRAAESIAIPSTIRAYQQATDNQMRETRDKTIKQLTPRIVSRIKNDFKSSYMVDNGLASKVTIWGEKVKRFEDGTNVALQLFDLNKTKIYKGDFGTKIFELYEKTKDKDVLPEILKPSIRYKKENVTLDPKTFEEYQIYVGQMLKKRTESLVNSMEWESMSDDSKIKSLRRLFVGDSSRRGAYMDSFVRQNREKLNELWINQFSGEKKK